MAASLPPAGFGAAAPGGSCCRTEEHLREKKQRESAKSHLIRMGRRERSFNFIPLVS